MTSSMTVRLIKLKSPGRCVLPGVVSLEAPAVGPTGRDCNWRVTEDFDKTEQATSWREGEERDQGQSHQLEVA